MKSLKYLFFLLFLLFLECSKQPTESESIISDYKLVFDYLKSDYGYRDELFKGQSLDAIYKKYLPRIEKTPTKIELAKILLTIEHQELQDPHVYFSGTEKPRNLVEEFEVKSYVKEGADLFYPKLEAINIIKKDDFYTYGTVKTNPEIGYLYIRSFNRKTGGDSALGIPKGIDAVENYLKDLKDKGVKKMIVDIRSGAGGSSYVPLWIAKRFANKKAVYMIAEYDTVDGFKEEKWYVEPEGKEGFRKGKIALLTNGNTCSGGEMFVLAMLQRDNLVHMGSETEGCAGNIVDRDLANGWNLRMTNGKTAKADGSLYWKVGLIPKTEFIVKNTSNEGEDKVIKKAIQELRK